MQTVEADGSTIDEAIESALESLQVGRDRVDIEILSDSTRGLFGMGGKRARVRATIRESLWEGGQQEARAGAAEQRPKSRGRAVAGGSRDKAAGDPGNRAERARDSAEEGPVQEEAGSREPTEERASVEAGEISTISEEAAEKAAEFLRSVLQLMGIEGAVAVETGEEPYNDVVLQFTGEASGVMIGRHGQTIDAIEYIVNRFLAREYRNEGHIVIDAAGYRMRRRQSLSDMARRLADKAKRERRTVTLNPLSPRDRRVVHIALRNDRGITTRSHGAGLNRKLLIIPGGGANRQDSGGPGPRRSDA